MSIYKNGKLVAGGRQATPLLSFVWADHILDEISWLRADTFSWQSGAVYQAVYQHLVDDIDGKSLQSETVGGTTIQFYLADDGHKIVPGNNANLVEDIYNATGVAWYYILDTVNGRFKLPRTKFGFTGLRDNVGKYVEPGLPNITGSAIVCGQNDKAIKIKSHTGAFKAVGTGSVYNDYDSSSQTTTYGIALDASDASSVYGASTTVQPPATQMYLYFYVGAFTQTALENTAGITAETLNDKADITAVPGLVIPDYANGTTQTMGTLITATEPGLVVFQAHYANSGIGLEVNGVCVEADYGEFNQLKTLRAFVDAGDTYQSIGGNLTAQSGYTPLGLVFYPFRSV